MMVALLVYAYCVGKPSSRRIERATFEDVAFRVLPDDHLFRYGAPPSLAKAG